MRTVSKPLAAAAVGVVAVATVKATESHTTREAMPWREHATHVRAARVQERPHSFRVGQERVSVKMTDLEINTTGNERHGMRYFVEREENRIEHVYPGPGDDLEVVVKRIETERARKHRDAPRHPQRKQQHEAPESAPLPQQQPESSLRPATPQQGPSIVTVRVQAKQPASKKVAPRSNGAAKRGNTKRSEARRGDAKAPEASAPATEVAPAPPSASEVVPAPPASEVAPAPPPASEVAPAPPPASEVAPAPTPASEVAPAPPPASEVALAPPPTSEVAPAPTPEVEAPEGDAVDVQAYFDPGILENQPDEPDEDEE